MLNAMSAIYEEETTTKALVTCENVDAFASMVQALAYQWRIDNDDKDAMQKAISVRKAILEALA